MSTPLHILIVEDSEDDALLLMRALRQGGYDLTFERVDTAAAMKAALAQQTWDIIISDYNMPNFDGLTALALMKESALDLPFIILSGAIGEEVAVEAMKAGAHDYIMKGNLVRLIPAIERELREADIRRQRRLAEDRIHQTNTELKEAIEKLRTSQAQLLQSEKLAAIGELVSGVAHEIRNPLTTISMYSEMLLKEVENEKAKKHVQILNEQTERVIAIVNNLLSFARKYEAKKSYVSMNEGVVSTVELLTYELRVKNIKTTLELDPDLAKTMADYNQLQQVFLNIITNAEQAMTAANGKGTLTIATKTVGEMIRITFADDGPGIPASKLDRIFEPFFTTKEVGKGTGLGLSICYGIIKDHDGQIYVDSATGGGTTFIIDIPIVSEAVGCLS